MTPAAFTDSVTSIAQLRDLRTDASRWLSDIDADEDTIATVALVLSEACTNALTHGRADAVDVEVTIDDVDGVDDGAVVTMCTRHDDHDVALLASLAVPTAMPPPGVACGRGLALVSLLVDGMTLRIDPPHVVRRCWLRTGGGRSGTG
jgi:anti-sigma regulatory factor (Ser/Thr protein kinase)